MSIGTETMATIAIKLEERGERFYRRAAQAAREPAVRDVFHRLAEDERQHAEAFKVLLTGAASEPELPPEDLDYVRGILGDSLFRPDQEAEPPQDPREALMMGIQAEKDSILLYHEMYDRATSDEQRKALDKLLKHEKFHLLELRESLDEIG